MGQEREVGVMNYRKTGVGGGGGEEELGGQEEEEGSTVQIGPLRLFEPPSSSTLGGCC